MTEGLQGNSSGYNFRHLVQANYAQGYTTSHYNWSDVDGRVHLFNGLDYDIIFKDTFNPTWRGFSIYNNESVGEADLLFTDVSGGLFRYNIYHILSNTYTRKSMPNDITRIILSRRKLSSTIYEISGLVSGPVPQDVFIDTWDTVSNTVNEVICPAPTPNGSGNWQDTFVLEEKLYLLFQHYGPNHRLGVVYVVDGGELTAVSSPIWVVGEVVPDGAGGTTIEDVNVVIPMKMVAKGNSFAVIAMFEKFYYYTFEGVADNWSRKIIGGFFGTGNEGVVVKEWVVVHGELFATPILAGVQHSGSLPTSGNYLLSWANIVLDETASGGMGTISFTAWTIDGATYTIDGMPFDPSLIGVTADIIPIRSINSSYCVYRNYADLSAPVFHYLNAVTLSLGAAITLGATYNIWNVFPQPDFITGEAYWTVFDTSDNASKLVKVPLGSSTISATFPQLAWAELTLRFVTYAFNNGNFFIYGGANFGYALYYYTDPFVYEGSTNDTFIMEYN